MTTGVVTFDPDAFKARFPEFFVVDNAALGLLFDEATLVVDNTARSRVQQIEHRRPLLYLLTAHLAKIYLGTNGEPPAGLVGRINQAHEGSVSVGADMGNVPFTAAWFMQTKYGAEFWQASARWRQMRYIPGRSRAAPGPTFWGAAYG
jgi:hypothetical protein